jgi:hypothetical protein
MQVAFRPLGEPNLIASRQIVSPYFNLNNFYLPT